MQDPLRDPLENVKLRPQRLSDQVKTILKQAILDGRYKSGDKLPPEDQIAKKFTVSKVTAREALREMESEGLIVKRRGIYGGSFVAEPGAEKMGELVVNYYRFGGLTPEELVEFRRMMEPAMVALAVERCTEADLDAFRKNIEEVEAAIDSGKPDQAKGIDFHRLIGNACHNRLVSALMDALVKVFLEILSIVPMTLEDARGDLEYNKQFYHFMLHGQTDDARDLMVSHFDTLSRIIERGKSGNIENVHDG